MHDSLKGWKLQIFNILLICRIFIKKVPLSYDGNSPLCWWDWVFLQISTIIIFDSQKPMWHAIKIAFFTFEAAITVFAFRKSIFWICSSVPFHDRNWTLSRCDRVINRFSFKLDQHACSKFQFTTDKIDSKSVAYDASLCERHNTANSLTSCKLFLRHYRTTYFESSEVQGLAWIPICWFLLISLYSREFGLRKHLNILFVAQL